MSNEYKGNPPQSSANPPTTLRSEANAIVVRLGAVLDRIRNTYDAVHGPAQQANAISASGGEATPTPNSPPVANSIIKAHSILDKIETVVNETAHKL